MSSFLTAHQHIIGHFSAMIFCKSDLRYRVVSAKPKVSTRHHRTGSLSAFEKWSGQVVPKCCRKGLGYDFKRQRILKKISWQKKWSGHGRTGRTADYGPAEEQNYGSKVQLREPPPSESLCSPHSCASSKKLDLLRLPYSNLSIINIPIPYVYPNHADSK